MKSKSLQISLLAILLGAFFTAFSPEISAKGNTKNTSSSLEWYSRGPQNIGGSVRAILIDQQDASQQTLIIGSEAGGIWMSTDGGTNWNPINYEKNLFVTSLTQTDNGDIFIGTGGDYQGSGLYKMSGSTITPINDSEWSSINDLASKENNVYIASSEGLKYYDGNTFTTCTADGVSLEGVATEVQVNEGGKIIAVVEKACYISNSSFDAFVNHSTGEANQLPLPNVTGSLAITSDNMNDNLFYASVVKTTGVLHSILISTDGGNNWEVILQGGGSIDPFVLDKVKYGLVH
ncbi:MAG: hypothetical protein PHR53_06380, partial [Bacteroidales bacterium]|nr:hypothetical protein [Bacteroidales bacterium]